jgi:hypothetical protein
LLTGFGEIEYLFSMCLASAFDDEDSALRAYFGLRVESARIAMAHELMRGTYVTLGLRDRLETCRVQTKYCHSARNMFSHCHWSHHLSAGLFYTNLEDSARSKDTAFRSAHKFLHVDDALLTKIE